MVSHSPMGRRAVRRQRHVIRLAGLCSVLVLVLFVPMDWLIPGVGDGEGGGGYDVDAARRDVRRDDAMEERAPSRVMRVNACGASAAACPFTWRSTAPSFWRPP